MRKRSKWSWGAICLLLIIIFAVIFFRQAILVKAGRYMAPQTDGKADVAILEGEEFIPTAFIASAMKLKAFGKIGGIIVVIQKIAPENKSFGINEDYRIIVGNQLKNLGWKNKEFKIIVDPTIHPITLTETQAVLTYIPQEQIKSAILIAKGFHTRRSYLAYQQAGLAAHIKIFPLACLTAYGLDNWWVEGAGLREFTVEFLKLIYYWAKGYIPFFEKN
jgi:uncharacterized SAM-binding protein YcdF (DUF218 family)